MGRGEAQTYTKPTVEREGREEESERDKSIYCPTAKSAPRLRMWLPKEAHDQPENPAFR